jgi:spore coat protein U-like protein
LTEANPPGILLAMHHLGWFAALALALGLLAPRAAHAQSCSNLAATTINFGNYDVYDTADTLQVGTITYSCKTVAPRVEISASANGAYRPRQMGELFAFGNALNYDLYADAARTIVWGTGADAQTLPRTATGSSTVYGRIFAGQDVDTGFYFDFITVTFNF